MSAKMNAIKVAFEWFEVKCNRNVMRRMKFVIKSLVVSEFS